MSVIGRFVLLALLLVGLLALAIERSLAPDAKRDSGTEQALKNLQLAAAELRSNVLAARAGLLQSYDPLVAEIDTMRQQARIMQATAGDTGRIGHAIVAAVEAKEDLLERFKSDNAILQNALATFDLTSARLVRARTDPNLALAVGSLASMVTHLARQPGPEIVQATKSMLDTLDDYDFGQADATAAKSLIRHGRILVDLLPRVDDLVRQLQVLTLTPKEQALAAIMAREAASRERVSSAVHWLLYGTAFVTAILFLRAGVGLRVRTQALQGRIALETSIAEASNLFVSCPSEEIDARLGDALTLFGKAEGADRAYLLGREPNEACLWLNKGVTEPLSWPASRRGLLDLFGDQTGPIICEAVGGSRDLGSVGEHLWREGICTLVCATLTGGSAGGRVLAFEHSTPLRASSAETEVSLKLMAEVLGAALTRREAARQQTDLERKLRRAERLQSLGTFAGGVAHNFNNVLNVIIGQAELATAESDAGPQARRRVREIIDAGHQARGITGQILGFARSDRHDFEILAIEPLVFDAVRQIETAMGRQAVLSIESATVGARTRGDLPNILQVIVNVIQNAVQASSPGSVVFIAANVTSSTGETLSHGRLDAGAYARVAVVDHGCGMTAAEAARMFDPFFTNRNGGTGLGLATAQDTVGDMGGAFDVETAPGRGTRVTIWLPLVGDLPAAKRSGGTVLLLGSDRAKVERDEDMLAALGYEPVGFTEPASMFLALSRDARKFDLAILDSVFATQDAGALMGDLRAALPHATPILLTTCPDGAAPRLRAGVAAVLVRPWHAQSVAATLARCLQPARIQQAPRHEPREHTGTLLPMSSRSDQAENPAGGTA